MVNMAKRKKSRRSKKSAFRAAKGALYVGAVALPMYQAYNQLGGGANGAAGAVKAAAFMDASGNFSMAHGAQIWKPVAVLTVVDIVTSKTGIQRRIARAISGILG